MGRAIGGDILEVTYNHPTLGTGTFFPKANEDSTLDLGGFRGDDDANMVDGGGANIKKLNRARWSFEVVIAVDQNISGDMEKVSALAAHPQDATWTITHMNGAVYQGLGSPVGDVQWNGNAATNNLKVAGGGVLKKIA